VAPLGTPIKRVGVGRSAQRGSVTTRAKSPPRYGMRLKLSPVLPMGVLLLSVFVCAVERQPVGGFTGCANRQGRPAMQDEEAWPPRSLGRERGSLFSYCRSPSETCQTQWWAKSALSSRNRVNFGTQVLNSQIALFVLARIERTCAPAADAGQTMVPDRAKRRLNPQTNAPRRNKRAEVDFPNRGRSRRPALPSRLEVPAKFHQRARRLI
jgi:hypothetical protein